MSEDTPDDYEQFRRDIVDEVVGELEGKIPDGETLPKDFDVDAIATTDDVQEIAEATTVGQLEHLIHEDCETPACNQMREQLGVTHDHDHDDGESGGGDGTESEQGPEHPDPDDGDGGGEEVDSDDGADGETLDDDGNDYEWEPDENIFGEKA